MCQLHTPHRHPLQCIIPPYMLQSIIEKGTPEQRERALRSYGISNSVRTARSIASAFPVRSTLLGSGFAASAGKIPTVQRTIYDAHHKWDLPGTVVRAEGQAPTGDPAADEAYDGLGSTFDFYQQIYQRNSIDNQGLPLLASVHYGDENNAFWNSRQLIFGDGDGVLFNRFTSVIDVIAHEFTHGVTQYAAELYYERQSGALNESISDVFGSLVKQYMRKQTADQADWLIGQGLFTANVQGVALRSMKAPGTAYNDPVLGKDPQPAHMANYDPTPMDNYGVHINSGIPNRAFCLAATSLGGFAWEKAGLIWYTALHDPALRPNAEFMLFAHLTVKAADQLYGSGNKEGQAIRNAWNEVGVSVTPIAAARSVEAGAMAESRQEPTNGHDGRKQGLKEALDMISDLLAHA